MTTKKPTAQNTPKDDDAATAEALNKETGEVLSRDEVGADGWPEGFEAYDLTLDNYPAWDWDSRPMMVGVIQKVDTVPLMRKGKQVDVSMAVVKVGDDEFALWESAYLKPLLVNAYPQMQVAIKFTGWENMPGGKRARKFEAKTRG